MSYHCVECNNGMKMCGDPPPPCPMTFEELAASGWVQAGCYNLAIMIHPESCAVALVPVDAEKCCEPGGGKAS